MPTSVIDRPLNGDNEKDLFDINGYQRALVEFIRGAEAPLTIALQGEWGSGKTSLMNYLKANLTQGNVPYYAIEINTWHYSMFCTPDQAVVEILHSILEQMGVVVKDKSGKFVAISKQLLTFTATAAGNILGQTIGIDEVGSSLLEASKSCQNGTNNTSYNLRPASSKVEQLKTKIKQAIDNVFIQQENSSQSVVTSTNSNSSNEKPKGFLFFIDDLDRIDPPLAVKILELLKNICSVPNTGR